MANIRIIKNNLTDTATLTATSTETGFSVENIKLDAKSSVWRSTTLTAQDLTFTWASAQVIDSVGMAFTNLIDGSSVRIKLYTETADVVAIYDSGALTVGYSYPPPDGFTTVGLASFPYGGGVYFSSFFDAKIVKKMVITIDSSDLRGWITSFYDWWFSLSTLTNPDGYVEVSRIVCGQSWYPTHNVSYGLQTGTTDNTESVRTDSGNMIFDRRTVHKSIDITFGFLTSADKKKLAEILRIANKNKPVFISIFPEDGTEEEQAGQIYGVIEDTIPVLDFNDRYSANIKVIEV